MEYNDFENILNAYFFKDMLQNMLQNHFLLENINTLFWKRAVQDIHCISCILYNIHISERSVNQFMKTMLIQQSVGLHFKEKEIETYEKS